MSQTHAARQGRPVRKGGLGALRGLARSMSHSFEMAREKARMGREDPELWNGVERRVEPRRRLGLQGPSARMIAGKPGERRSSDDRRKDRALARLGAQARRQNEARAARSRWA